MSDIRMIEYSPGRPALDDSRQRGQALHDLLAGRRSVRSFSPEPVPRELIETAVRCAGTAPSGANLQPWTFVAVSDATLKHDIRLGAEEEERQNYASRMSDVWKEDLQHLGTDWHKPMLDEAPWLIVVFKQNTRPDGRPNYYVQESVGLAVGMLLTAFRAMGLCTLTHTPSPMQFLARILSRPANERPFLLIPVGWPSEPCLVPDIKRKPLDEILVIHDGS